MDIRAYLPDELGKRAKDADLNFSRLLRSAVTDELERRKAMSETLADPDVYELDLVDEEGQPYVGRITGTRIAEAEPRAVFLTDDERVILYDAEWNDGRYWELDDPETELRERLPDGPYAEAMRALGIKVAIDL